jgi:hypothetical protein
MHVYVMRAWKVIPILFTFQSVVEGGNVDNLTIAITRPFLCSKGVRLKKKQPRA